MQLRERVSFKERKLQAAILLLEEIWRPIWYVLASAWWRVRDVNLLWTAVIDRCCVDQGLLLVLQYCCMQWGHPVSGQHQYNVEYHVECNVWDGLVKDGMSNWN